MSWDKIDYKMFTKLTAKLKKENKKAVYEWTFNKLERGGDGKYYDGDLAKILMDATDHPAGALKARGTLPVMKIVEIMTMHMARKWGVCTVSLQSVPIGHY